MKKIFFILISIFFLVSIISPISASDVLVWQGQYYTGTTFNTGTYNFNFTVYDNLTAGNICYSNATLLITGIFGDWKTEQYGVNSACNNISKDYFLNININGESQIPRRRLVIWNYLRKDVDEISTGKLQVNSSLIVPVIQANTSVIALLLNATQIITTNLTTINYGFFNSLGSLANRIITLFVQDIDASGNVNVAGNVASSHFIGEGSLLTNLSVNNGLSPVYLKNNLFSTNADYITIFNLTLTPNKMNIIKAYLVQSSSTNGVAIQNRVILNDSGNAGNCYFITQTGDTSEAINNIPTSVNSEDTGVTSMSLDINIPFINEISCTILADASQKNLIIQFESETTANVTTYTGSYYTNNIDA